MADTPRNDTRIALEWLYQAVSEGITDANYAAVTNAAQVLDLPASLPSPPVSGEAAQALVTLNTMAEGYVGTIVDNAKAEVAWNKREEARKVLQCALTSEPVGVTTQWRHKKRGTVYTEIGRGKAQASTEFIADDDDVVIYRGEDGLIWVRQVKEFEDGRFDRLSAAIGERG